jgi:hypothetical protein
MKALPSGWGGRVQLVLLCLAIVPVAVALGPSSSSRSKVRVHDEACCQGRRRAHLILAFILPTTPIGVPNIAAVPEAAGRSGGPCREPGRGGPRV